MARKAVKPDSISRSAGSVEMECQFSVCEDVFDGSDRGGPDDLEACALSQRAREARAWRFPGSEVVAG